MHFKLMRRLATGAATVALAAAAMADTPAGPRYGAFGVDLSAENTAVKPGDDFWNYVNGTWDQRTAIAPDRVSAGVWVTLSDQSELQVRQILDDAAKNPAMGTGAQQLGDLYATFVDTAAIDAAGTRPLAPYFARIDAAGDREKLQALFAQPGYASPVGLGQLPDPADPDRYAVGAVQGELGMGARDNYLLPGAKYDAIRAAYRAYVEKMLVLAGLPDAGGRADRIVALETAMAKAMWSPVQMRDVQAMIKPMDAAGRRALAPQFDWPLMLRTAGYDAHPVVIMSTSTALTGMGKVFADTPVSTWQDWVKFNFVSAKAGVLPRPFDDAHFDFFGRTLNDQQEQRARWKRGVAMVNGAMGEAVGAIYVKRFYPPESEAKMNELIGDLRAAYQQRISAAPWMDEATRAKALVKLAAFDPRIGHPVRYVDYSSLKVVRGDALGNAVRAGRFEHDLELSRLPKPVDRTLWDMTPQEINAYYNPSSNQITFPAAILQAPMFDPRADPAVNYGAIGAVIGHEMGHGFDDQGSQFGPTGKLENWWTPQARTAFTQRTAALSGQYDGYEGIPGTHVKGALTLGENIGDLGGVEAAYSAFQRYQAKHGRSPVIDGLTGDQRFFLGWAQVWRSKEREGALRQQLITDPHSPPHFRVNGVVRNVDAWYTAFGIKPGDGLYLAPADRVHIW